MNKPKPVTDDTIQIAINKWSSYIPDGPNGFEKQTAGQLALLLNNQKRYFDEHLSTDARTYFNDMLGEQWEEAFFHALVKMVLASDILKQVAVQPMTQPIGAVAYLTQGRVVNGNAVDALAGVADEKQAEIPEIRMDLKTKEVAAKTNPMSAMFPPAEEMADFRTAFGIDTAKGTLEAVLKEVVDSRQRHIIGEIRNVAKHSAVSPCDEDGPNRADRIRNAIRRATYTVHKRTMRGPANRVVAGGDLSPFVMSSVVEQRVALLHTDPMFPNDEILLWYNGASLIDSVAIWAPFYVAISVDEQEVMVDQDGEKVAEKRQKIRIGFRDAVVVVNENAAALVKVPAKSGLLVEDGPNTLPIED